MRLPSPKCSVLRIFLVFTYAMLLAGCSILQTSHVENHLLYLLDSDPSVKTAYSKRDAVLAISMPRARPGFDTPRMAYLRQPHELEYFAVNQWADAPSRMLGPLLAQTLDQTGSFRAIVLNPSLVSVDLRLDTELVRLQQDFGTKPSRVRFTLRAQLIDVAGKRVIAARVFDETANVIQDDAYGGVIAANQAVQGVLIQLAEFCISESGRRWPGELHPQGINGVPMRHKNGGEMK